MKKIITYVSLFLLLIDFIQINSLEQKTTVQNNINISEEELTEKLIEAAKQGDVDSIKKLIAAGVNVNSMGKQGVTALFMALMKNRTDAVEELINANANVNCSLNLQEGKLNALSLAIRHHNLKIVQKLIKAGANVNEKLDKDSTCLYMAIKANDSEVVKELIQTEGVIVTDNDITTAQKVGGEILELLKPFIQSK